MQLSSNESFKKGILLFLLIVYNGRSESGFLLSCWMFYCIPWTRHCIVIMVVWKPDQSLWFFITFKLFLGGICDVAAHIIPLEESQSCPSQTSLYNETIIVLWLWITAVYQGSSPAGYYIPINEQSMLACILAGKQTAFASHQWSKSEHLLWCEGHRHKLPVKSGRQPWMSHQYGLSMFKFNKMLTWP